jgi:queuosine biosynthesis protein QueD
MQLTLHTEGWYDAAHHLENYEGKCANKHGHTYKVEVWIKGDSSHLDKSGILWDFGNLKKIINEYDHKDLNDIYKHCNSTAENQCMMIYNSLISLNGTSNVLKFKVRVYEQIAPKKSYCECGDF